MKKVAAIRGQRVSLRDDREYWEGAPFEREVGVGTRASNVNSDGCLLECGMSNENKANLRGVQNYFHQRGIETQIEGRQKSLRPCSSVVH